MLKKHRKAAGYHFAKEFADALNLEVDTVYKYEQGAYSPASDTVAAMAKELELIPEDAKPTPRLRDLPRRRGREAEADEFLGAAEHDQRAWDELERQATATEVATSTLSPNIRPLRQAFPRLSAQWPRWLPPILIVILVGAVLAGLLGHTPSWLELFTGPKAVTIGTGSATATAAAHRLATATSQASTPDALFRLVTQSTSPVLSDPLQKQDTNGWNQRPIPQFGGCAYDHGAYEAYVLTHFVMECYAQSLAALPSATIFGLQVELKFLRGDGGAGLVFAHRDHLPYYRFAVTPSGYFDLYDPVTRIRFSAGETDPGTQTELTAIVQISTIYLYINGVYVGGGFLESGASLTGQQLGLFSDDGPHNPTIAAFHNMKVWAML